MDETMDIPSPNSLLNAEGDVDSSFGETSPKDNTAETQAADVLCALGIFNVRQADDIASTTMELCLPEHTAASTASQTEEDVDQAIIPAPAPAGSEASRTEANQAMALTVAPAVSESSPAEAAIISASEKEPESREDIQQTTEEPVKPPESPRRVVLATEPESEGNAQETVTQAVTLDVGLSFDSPPIEAEELMADIDDGIASADSSQCRADTGTASTIPYTASRYREASRGRRSVTQESSDLPISIDESAEFIIVDDNGGQAIVIDSSDDEIGLDDDDSGQSPRRRAQRKRSTPQSPQMVNWASKEYKTRSAASLTAAWENMWEQWEQIRAKPDRRLAQALYRLHKKIFKALYRFWEKHGVERKAMRQLTRKRDSELVRKLGRALRRLQEAEEEYLSISVAMNDRECEDGDYVPTKARRLQ
ncbi:hypothetical protein CC80DRAFT_572371 [Byssothecium circinans]|uniref:Uncharacterized protein n=1 Tax=Byssothecium circinans TaxID=147558 RepID=A0A6A5TJF8_9PLEO|nr:hypothetical protein CC80DRAFT_572371 [Byssothecium circinans]